MNDDRDEILDELRALLAVEPTAGFESRVARAVDAATPTRRWLVLGAVAAVGAAVGIMTMEWRHIEPPEPQPVIVKVVVPNVGVAPVATVPVRKPAKRATVAGHAQRAEPEVLVPPDQAIALKALMAAVREGRTVFVPDVPSDGPLVVEPLPDLGQVRPQTPDARPEPQQPRSDSHRMENHVFTPA